MIRLVGNEPVFKSSNNIFYTKQLFYEQADTDRSLVLYTLKNEDHMGYPSLRRLYLEENDPTEYRVATKYFAGWPHWKKLLDVSWFMDYISEYREELQIRMASEALVKIREKANSGDYRANQYILEEGYAKKESVGRPTKERIIREANKIADGRSDISEDFDRVMAQIGSFQ